MEIEGTLVGTNRHWGIGGKVGAVVLCFPIADMDDLLLMKPGRRVRLVIEDEVADEPSRITCENCVGYSATETWHDREPLL